MIAKPGVCGGNKATSGMGRWARMGVRSGRVWRVIGAACLFSLILQIAGASEVQLLSRACRISPAAGGTRAQNTDLAVSADGRFVVFDAPAGNLVPDDTNHVHDVFVRDRQTGHIARISVTSDGQQADGSAGAISADGRFVAFMSSRMIANAWDTQIIVRDISANTTELISQAVTGAPADRYCSDPSISADGRYVSYVSSAGNLVANVGNGWPQIYVYDRQTRTTTCVSQSSTGEIAEGFCLSPRISGNGQFVAFQTGAYNLVPNDTNGVDDIFLRNLQDGTILRVSVATDGSESNATAEYPSISNDGRFVTFSSRATNLANNLWAGHSHVFLRDMQNSSTACVSMTSEGIPAFGNSIQPVISRNGARIAFVSTAADLVSADTNNCSDIFVYTRETGQIVRANVSSTGQQIVGSYSYSARPALSESGDLVVFFSDSPGLVAADLNYEWDVFEHDLQSGQTALLSTPTVAGETANSNSFGISLSSNGRFAAFTSWADNLVEGDTNGEYDIFVVDRVTNRTQRVSISSSGEQGNGRSYSPVISSDGRYVSFTSYASNLVPDDTNNNPDVFIFDRQTNSIERVNLNTDGSQLVWGNSPSISTDARFVLFFCDQGVFIRDRSLRTSVPVVPSNGGAPFPTGDLSWRISGDGRFLLYGGGVDHIYRRDLSTGETIRVDVATDGTPANGGSDRPVISADGRFVAFESFANNLVPEDTNSRKDIFVHDCTTRETTSVTAHTNSWLGGDDCLYPSISADGRFVAYACHSYTLAPEFNSVANVFVYDRQTGATVLVSPRLNNDLQFNTEVWGTAISPNGRYVGFDTAADNVVPEDFNFACDTFLSTNPLATTALSDVYVDASYLTPGEDMDDDDQFVTISAAVMSVNEFGNVHVADGDYPEDVVIERSLALYGDVENGGIDSLVADGFSGAIITVQPGARTEVGRLHIRDYAYLFDADLRCRVRGFAAAGVDYDQLFSSTGSLYELGSQLHLDIEGLRNQCGTCYPVDFATANAGFYGGIVLENNAGEYIAYGSTDTANGDVRIDLMCPPDTMTVSATQTSRPLFNWDAVSGIDAYEVRVVNDYTGEVLNNTNALPPYRCPVDLTPSWNYRWYVRTRKDSLFSEWKQGPEFTIVLPCVSVVATDASASEPGTDTGTFTVTRTGSTDEPLTVSFLVSGSATGGTDYKAIGSSLTIPAGQTSATVTVTPINDTQAELDEEVILSLIADSQYTVIEPSSAVVTIADNETPRVLISATDAMASEPGTDMGTFTITRLAAR